MQEVGGDILIDADFDVDTDGFVYQDDPFFGTNQPAFADGQRVPDGFTGSGLEVTVGGIDNTTVNNMSGGWSRSFNLAAGQPLTLSFRYNLTQQPDYESDEFTDAIVTLDGQPLPGDQPGIIDRITGNGNGGPAQTTDWVQRTLDLGTVAAGNHTLIFGIFNNKKTFNNEFSDIRYDDVLLTAGGVGGDICPSVLVSPAEGSTVNGNSVTLTWSECSQATARALHVGTFLGGADLANPSLTAADTSFTLNNLPGGGATIFVRVWTFTGTWQSTDSTFISQ